MARAKANGIEIEYESIGKDSDPTILLIMGLGAQLTLWPDSLCAGLAQRGFRVVRYDNRDVGLSTDFGAWGMPDFPAAVLKLVTGKKVDAPYVLNDMAADAVGLLDALGVDRAHMVGASMGGMIAQILAARHATRTRSLVSIMSTSGRPGLPQGKPEAMQMLMAQPEGPAREQIVRHAVKLRTVIGSPGFPADSVALRALVERNVDRRYYPEGAARQYLAVLASGDRVELLKSVRVRTLVLHGADDPLIHPDGARDVAKLVPGAALELFPGWGHDVPEQMVPVLVDRIAKHCAAA